MTFLTNRRNIYPSVLLTAHVAVINDKCFCVSAGEGAPIVEGLG